ncbi:hypothetical protein M408DRAFT_144880 [Serendipita vermifera MAFF 305830]|uniref:Uncharacterized protein n=1 Tax=Serendipita vermifera MAFF 305830 TaxID=933852 RepID=A0A0C3B9W0_SERVB|nr:hypothetical protein M408DRAFT_144880 [Serendipita vermifera MAFF 305830]
MLFKSHSLLPALSRVLFRLPLGLVSVLLFHDLFYRQPEDIEEYVPQWQKWFLVLAGGIAGIAWGFVACFDFFICIAFGFQEPDTKFITYAGSTSFFWMYTALRILSRPLRTAPIGNILFYLLQAVITLDLTGDAFLELGVFHYPFFMEFLLASSALFIAQTLPVSPVWP